MSVYKRGKYWIVQFNHNNRTFTRSSKSTRKRDALELERQMRQQIVDTQVLGHREHVKVITPIPPRVMACSASCELSTMSSLAQASKANPAASQK